MPAVDVVLRAVISDFQAKMVAARGEMEKTSKAGASHFGALSKGVAVVGAAVGAGALAIAASSVKAAGDFQQNMSKLVTSGGELSKNLGGDMRGVEKLMYQTGTSSEQLAKALYVINSAGFHARDGLVVLKAAAEGAKTENADVAVVTDGLTTLLNDYRLKASAAALVTSKMVEATAHGKTTFEELAGSLHTVSPIAHAVGLSMNEVLGAMATMTGEGTPAADAATYLRFAIGNLANPTAKARSEMGSLGLSATDISKNLGARGLTGTFDLLTGAIVKHMGPQGLVLIENMKKAAGSTTAFQKILANLPPTVQTQVGALADMVGGTKGMQAALELTGGNAKVFAGNVKAVGGAATEAGGHVAGWGTVQKNFNQQMAEANGEFGALRIEIGQRLIPIIGAVIGWVTKHTGAVKAMAIMVGVVAVAAIGAFVAATIAGMAAATVATGGIILAIGLLVVAGLYLATHWHQVWSNIKQWFDDALRFLRSGFGTLGLLILGPIGVLAILALHWRQIWGDIKAWTLAGVNAVGGFFARLAHDVTNWSLNAYNGVVGFFQRMWQGTVRWSSQIWTDVVGWFDRLYNSVIGVVGRLARDIVGVGASVVNGLIRGITTAVDFPGRIGTWLHNALNSALHFLGIHLSAVSDSSTMFEVGKRIVSSMAKGIEASPAAVVKALEHVIGGALSKAASTGAGILGLHGVGKGPAPGTGTSGIAPGFSNVQALGQQMAAAYGWTGLQWTELNALVMSESGWNPTAQNPTSPAYGIAQNIKGRAGYPDPSTQGQIAWLLQYVKSKYGNPENAWGFHLANGWYDRGGILPPGLSLALNTTGHDEIHTGGAGYGGTTIIVNVEGSVVSDRQLVDAIHTGLLRKQQRGGLGFRVS